MEEPPLWKTLINFCLQELASDSLRILIFPNEARKTLFSLALLAYHDFSTDDLASINVWLVSLRRFNQWQRFREYLHVQREIVDSDKIPPINKLWHPLLVGIPRYEARYAPVLRCSKLDVLLYQHQINSFQYSIGKCVKALQEEHSSNLQTLQTLASETQQVDVKYDNSKSKHIVTATPRRWKVEESKEIVVPEIKKLFTITDRVEEIAWLMQENEEATFDDKVLIDNTSSEDRITQQNTITTDQIIHIKFKEGFHIQFPLNATVQVVLQTNTGLELDNRERTVRSLRPNDLVLFIHGQHRQNLYELIVSRVHAHPSIALSVNLIHKWQDEIAESVRKSNLKLDEILTQMKQLGSQLQTTQAIRFWIHGQVLCPHDPSDLHRVAEILKMSFTQQYHQEIARAAKRLRGIHRGLSRRLNQWLQHGAVEASSSKIHDFIDPELGITFNDFEDALQLLTVKETKQKEGLYLMADLGQLLQEEK